MGLGLELRSKEKEVKRVTYGSVGKALESEGGEFAFHGINGIRC